MRYYVSSSLNVALNLYMYSQSYKMFIYKINFRLSLIRNSNAVAVTSGVKGEHINQQISTSAAAAAATASSSPAVVSSSQKSEEKGTILAVDSDGSQPVTALRKKMVVTNKSKLT